MELIEPGQPESPSGDLIGAGLTPRQVAVSEQRSKITPRFPPYQDPGRLWTRRCVLISSSAAPGMTAVAGSGRKMIFNKSRLEILVAAGLRTTRARRNSTDST